MPELPEVETVVRSLRRHLPRGGRRARLERAELRFPGMLKFGKQYWPRLDGCEITDVGRAGKYIWIACRSPAGPRGAPATVWRLLLHLGMSGQLTIEPAAAALAAHTHAIFHLAGARQLRFRDPRRFGRIGVVPAAADSGGAANRHAGAMDAGSIPAALSPEEERQLGIPPGGEPLEIGEAEFVKLFRGRQAPIKNALMNQRLLRGLGNIYADESLFRAGIAPRAHDLSAPRLRRLRLAIRQVLEEAIRAGGSSISDYVDSGGKRGWFQFQHRVYGREGQPCPQCGAPIRRITLAGRSAHFCPHCQT